MVFVPMGDKNSPDTINILDQIINVRYDNVDTWHVVFREQNASIYNDYVLVGLENHHVFADFAQPAERENFQCFNKHMTPRSFELYLRVNR